MLRPRHALIPLLPSSRSFAPFRLLPTYAVLSAPPCTARSVVGSRTQGSAFFGAIYSLGYAHFDWLPKAAVMLLQFFPAPRLRASESTYIRPLTTLVLTHTTHRFNSPLFINSTHPFPAVEFFIHTSVHLLPCLFVDPITIPSFPYPPSPLLSSTGFAPLIRSTTLLITISVHPTALLLLSLFRPPSRISQMYCSAVST
ncbi:hypothetical protein C8J57DRAFT_1722645, partial [Mycena rebaudengoi]